MIELFAMIVKLLSDIGLMKVIHCVIKTITKPYKIGKAMVLCIFVGEAVATGVLSDVTSKYIDNSLDTAAKFICDHGLDKSGIWKKWANRDNKEDSNVGDKQLNERGSVQAKFKQS